MKLSIAALMLCFSIFTSSAQAGPIDITLLIDSSGSNSFEDYEELKDYTHNLVDEIRGINADTAFGLIEFSTNAVIQQQLTQNTTTVHNAIDSTFQMGGQTNWTAALNMATSVINDSGRPAADQFLILITDGVHNQGSFIQTIDVANQLKSNGALIYGVDYANGVASTASQDIVSFSGGSLFAQVPQASDLNATIPDILDQINALSPPVVPPASVPAPASTLLVLFGIALVSLRKRTARLIAHYP